MRCLTAVSPHALDLVLSVSLPAMVTMHFVFVNENDVVAVIWTCARSLDGFIASCSLYSDKREDPSGRRDAIARSADAGTCPSRPTSLCNRINFSNYYSQHNFISRRYSRSSADGHLQHSHYHSHRSYLPALAQAAVALWQHECKQATGLAVLDSPNSSLFFLVPHTFDHCIASG